LATNFTRSSINSPAADRDIDIPRFERAAMSALTRSSRQDFRAVMPAGLTAAGKPK
jgi:hypothetical protein